MTELTKLEMEYDRMGLEVQEWLNILKMKSLANEVLSAQIERIRRLVKTMTYKAKTNKAEQQKLHDSVKKLYGSMKFDFKDPDSRPYVSGESITYTLKRIATQIDGLEKRVLYLKARIVAIHIKPGSKVEIASVKPPRKP